MFTAIHGAFPGFWYILLASAVLVIPVKVFIHGRNLADSRLFGAVLLIALGAALLPNGFDYISRIFFHPVVESSNPPPLSLDELQVVVILDFIASIVGSVAGLIGIRLMMRD